MQQIDLDLWRNPLPICPVCHHVYNDVWELRFEDDYEGEEEITCPTCETVYHCERSVTFHYSTRKLGEEDE